MHPVLEKMKTIGIIPVVVLDDPKDAVALGAPAVLCELGFITNDSDVVALCSADVQRELARRIALGVEDYLDQKS